MESPAGWSKGNDEMKSGLRDCAGASNFRKMMDLRENEAD